MPDWTEQDKIALLALLTRFVRQYDGLAQLRAVKEEIEARIAAGSENMQKLTGAFSVFGVEAKGKGWGKIIHDEVGDDAYYGALADGGRTGLRENNSTEKVDTQTQTALPSAEAGDATIREMTLERLRTAGKRGTTASAIRDHIENVRGGKLHFKTVGMTLYRLSQDGLARREGRIWFAVLETANPGGGTPGPLTEAH